MKIITLLLIATLVSPAFTSAQSLADFKNFDMANTPAFTTNNFKAIGIGKGGHIWAGTQYGGLYKYNPNTMLWEKSTELTNVFINDIKADQKGGIWMAQSGITGTSGGGSNIAGGINYFPEEYFSTMHFYSLTQPSGGGLSSRNVRTLWIDTTRFNGIDRPRVWAAQASFTTSFNPATGGIGLGLNASADYFFKIKNGLEEGGLPSVLSIAGNDKEVWAMAQNNNNKSQILRYQSSNSSGNFLGAYDNTNAFDKKQQSVFTVGFRANAIYFDSENRQWIGQQNGGMVVKANGAWFKIDTTAIFPAGTTINTNAITGDAEGNVYIGTTSGLVVYRGGEVDDPNSYERLTTTDGLPSNSIFQIAVDTLNDRMLIATSNGVCFWKPNKRIKVKLAWDHSFPKSDIKPKGVAADGVTRLYLKIKRGYDTIPKFKEVKVSLKKFEEVDGSLRGRLKLATELEKYSDEASTGTVTEVSRTDSTPDGNFWFWYVAPEDFSKDANGIHAELSERRDVLKVKVLFADNSEDSTEFDMKVVRPPLLLVHGLASGPSTWDNLYTESLHAKPILGQSPLFKYTKALTMDGRGAFDKNARRLLSGDLSDEDAKLNSLQGNIEELRKMGYAANQVDYLCHSMGGIMIRGAAGWYADKFFSNGAYNYNNYGKGFVHKLIFVNTPHNSSPIADAVEEFVPKLPYWLNVLVTKAYKYDPALQMPFDFFQPKDKTDPSAYVFKASDAVRDLQINDNTDGVNLPLTLNIKNHLVIGDVDMTTTTLDELAAEHSYVQYLADALIRVARDFYEEDREELTILFDENYSPRQRMVLWWNLYSGKKGYPGFMADGDLIVPLQSETARQAETLPHIKKFLNTPGSVYDASHVTILARHDVGKHILDVLNAKRSDNPLFADVVQPNLDPPSGKRMANGRTAEVSVVSTFDTSKIVLANPLRTGAATFVDSTIVVNFRLKDTVGLAYINIHFQNTDSFRLNRNAAQQIAIKVSSTYTGPQLLWATAVYDKAGAVQHHTDTVSISVGNKATLQKFRIETKETEVTDKIIYLPEYEVMYNGKWVKLAGSDTSIKISIVPQGIVAYDSATSAFKAITKGDAIVYFTYKGFRDTVAMKSVMEIVTTDITFGGKIFLQGAYNVANGNMNTTLNSSGILQANASSQTYRTSDNYFGTEKIASGFFAANPNIVDWVLIELRDSSLPTAVIASRAAFVKKDGTLVDTSGTNLQITFKDVPPGSYYVVIKHRNHIAIRSLNIINFRSGSGSYDFTTALNKAFAGSVSNAPMVTLAPGVYGLWGGDINDDQQVKMTGFSANTNDYLKLLNTLGSSINTLNNVYSNQDVNMDGKVNMTGFSADNNDYLKLLNMLGSSINQITQPAF